MDFDLIANGIILGVGMVALIFALSTERAIPRASEAQRGSRRP